MSTDNVSDHASVSFACNPTHPHCLAEGVHIWHDNCLCCVDYNNSFRLPTQPWRNWLRYDKLKLNGNKRNHFLFFVLSLVLVSKP